MTEPNEGIENRLYEIEVQLVRIVALMLMQYARDNHMDAPRVVEEIKIAQDALKRANRQHE